MSVIMRHNNSPDAYEVGRHVERNGDEISDGASGLFRYYSGCCATFGGARSSIPGGMLNVRAPHSEGWLLAQADGTGMAFARSGKGKGESCVANMALFRLLDTTSVDEFISTIRRGSAAIGGVAKNSRRQACS